MKHALSLFTALLLLSPLASVAKNQDALPGPMDLRCNGQKDPLGIDAAPQLSWKLGDARRGAAQTAYQVLASSKPSLLEEGKGDVWDSGRIESAQSHLVSFGTPLRSGQRIHWKVRYWDQAGEPSPWSAPAWFETALLKPEDWQAKWVDAAFAAVNNASTEQWADFLLTRSAPAMPELEASYRQLLRDIPGPVVMGKDFTLKAVPETARVYVSAKNGMYTVFINGRRVGDTEYEPAFIAGNNPAPFYAVYDVTDLLRPGENHIRVLLKWRPYDHPCNGDHYIQNQPAKLLLQLNANTAGGSEVLAKTDDSWQQTASPIVKGHFYIGEVYDAKGHNALTADAGVAGPEWKPAAQSTAPVNVRLRFFEPERVVKTVSPQTVFSPAPGVWTFDLGEMITGNIEWTVPDDLREGDEVVFRYGSELREVGSHMPGIEVYYPGKEAASDPSRLLSFFLDFGIFCNIKALTEIEPKYRHIKAYAMVPCDLYLASGRKGAVWRSTERIHAFRYIEVVGLKTQPRPEDLKGLMIHTDSPRVGTFESSEPEFNRFHDLSVKTTLMNSHGFYADCWDREKWPWNGNWPKQRFMLYAHDDSRLNLKVTMDNAFAATKDGRAGLNAFGGGNSVLYPGSLIYLPWAAYQFTGDIRPLQDNFDAFLQHIRGVQKQFQQQPNSLIIRSDVLGDWLSMGQSKSDEWLRKNPQLKESWTDGTGFGAKIPRSQRSFLASATQCEMAGICAEIAGLLGRKEDQAWLQDFHSRMKAEINQVFFNPEAATYGRQPDSGPWGTDVEDSIALDSGIVPDEAKARVHEQLLDNLRKRDHAPITGIIASQPFLSVLAKFGNADDAYAVMAREEAPGIKSMLRASPDGLCEYMHAISAKPRMVGSRCHADMAGWAYWFYHGLGGLRPDWRQPGFKHFVLAPQIPKKMGFARITHESPYGKIVSSWKRDGARIRWEVVVPPNSTATAVFPDANAQEIRVETKSLKDAGLSAKAGENGTVTVELVAGAYAFEFNTTTE